jgi:hypothetical protein
MLDSTTQDGLALDKIAVAALRQADSISFHHNDGQSYINASKKVVQTARDPFGRTEVTINVPCKARINDYERGIVGYWVRPDEMKDYRCYENTAYPSEPGGPWQTIAGLLKPGDELTLAWSRGGIGTLGTRAHGMVGDMLELVVQRDRKRMTFLLDTQVGEDNTARMCKRTGYSLT